MRQPGKIAFQCALFAVVRMVRKKRTMVGPQGAPSSFRGNLLRTARTFLAIRAQCVSTAVNIQERESSAAGGMQRFMQAPARCSTGAQICLVRHSQIPPSISCGFGC